jgi:diguanylate cyclase (GGDEF)-like protein
VAAARPTFLVRPAPRSSRILDQRTLLVGFSVSSSLLALALLLAYRSQKRFPGLEWWSAAGLITGTVPLQVAAADDLQPLGGLGATLSLIAALSCIGAGMARYTGRKFPLAAYLGAAIAWTLVEAGGAAGGVPLRYRMGLFALLTAGLAAAAAAQLVRSGLTAKLASHRLTAGLFFLLSAFATVRGLWILMFGLGSTQFGPSMIHPIGLLTFQAIQTVTSVSLLAMVWSRLDQELQEQLRTVEELSIQDPLTGALNRRGFARHVEPQFDAARRHDRPFSLICLDLDHFKRVNDTHGHDAGDAVLQLLVATLLPHLRASDHVARMGGEEFVVALPETGFEGALILAERLREAVEASPAELNSGPLPATCSFGVAGRLPHDAEISQLLSRADAALYEAKRSGRNRVCASSG